MSGRLSKPIFGIDSYGETNPAVQHAIYSHFIGRYSSHQEGKCITRSEAEVYKANDIGVISVFEDGAGNATMGYDQGRSDALFAEQQTRDAGRPVDRPVFFAVDEDVSPSATDAYFAGVATVMGRDNCGPYGSAAVVEHHFAQGFRWAWQTLAWSGGVIVPRAQVYQYAINLEVHGCSMDFNRAYYEDFGQWNYEAPVVKYNAHYERFHEGSLLYRGRHYRERELVIEYDKLARHPRINHKKLIEIRKDLAQCAYRIRGLASEHREKDRTLPPEWAPYWRWWRFPQLADRANGKVF